VVVAQANKGFAIDFPAKPALKFIPTPAAAHKLIFSALFIMEPDLFETVVKQELRVNLSEH